MTASESRHVMPDVRVMIELDERRALAHVRGRVDCATVGGVRERLLDLAHSGIASLVVELDGAQLDDATGPAALLYVHDRCHALGVAFALDVAEGSPAAATLRDCGLLTVLRRT